MNPSELICRPAAATADHTDHGDQTAVHAEMRPRSPDTSLEQIFFMMLIEGVLGDDDERPYRVLQHLRSHVGGLFILWRTAQRRHLYWSTELLIGTLLIGFGAFNVVEGLIDHHLLGLHHVNELVDPHMIDAGSRLAAIAIKNDRESRSIAMTEPAEPRRLPAPWRVIEHSESLVVEDANGRPLAYVYFENEPVRRGLMNRLTSDEAWRVASNIAKLPELLKKS